MKRDDKRHGICMSSIDYGVERLTYGDIIKSMLIVIAVIILLGLFLYLVTNITNTNTDSVNDFDNIESIVSIDISTESTEDLTEWDTEDTTSMIVSESTESQTNTKLTAGITEQMTELLKNQENEEVSMMKNTEESVTETSELESEENETEVTFKTMLAVNGKPMEDVEVTEIIEIETETESITESEDNNNNNSDINFVDYIVPEYGGFKSYMSYLAITNTSSRQYKLQHEYATTDGYGIRSVDNRYCVAIGSHFEVEVGDYIDLILEDGTVLNCIVADLKADEDTDSNNIFSANGCATEFIVDIPALSSTVKSMGDISYADSCFKSRVKYIRVYDYNVFDN